MFDLCMIKIFPQLNFARSSMMQQENKTDIISGLDALVGGEGNIMGGG